MNVYRCRVYTHHLVAAVVVVAENEEEAGRIAIEETQKDTPECDKVESMEIIPLDVKRAYVLDVSGY